ncbi:MAG: NAD(P)/FAD-dependent oxidoreductase [Erysipelotrichaceae bacterium]|nr:NAD(P)/FAD-dependent oxidoreductase [Erysipelotrichaceae bacterium]
MAQHYDTVIIGCGEAGLYAAYELVQKAPDNKILILEKGKDLKHRKCPIVEGKVKECINCPTCAIMNGFGGAGAFSDGKFNFTTDFGGWLTDFIDQEEVMDLIEHVDTINVRFGATEERFTTNSDEARKLKKLALQNDLHLLNASCKHLGTENNIRILGNIYNYLKQHCDIRFNAEVTAIKKDPLTVVLKSGDAIECDYLVAAPGRSGAEWFSEQCRNIGLNITNNQVDVGVRVELPAIIFQHITDVVYESKLIFRTKQYGDRVRTFCMNPNGHVVTENVDGIMTVNGHSYSDPSLQSENTNFALLVSSRFTKPFNEPYKYGKHIASLTNMLGGGVIVQRYGDLLRGKRTTEHRMASCTTRPTLKAATPGDLSLAIPKRQLDDIIEMIEALDKIAPGTANYDTLLYGAEVKFYSSRIELNENLETRIPGFFAIGDGAGITRGLAQAGASGVKVARVIAERFNKR